MSVTQTAISKYALTYSVALVTVSRIPRSAGALIGEILSEVASSGVNVDMINQSLPYKEHTAFSFSLDASEIVTIMKAIRKFREHHPELLVEIDAFNAKLSVFGDAMKETPGTAAGVFTALASAGVEMKMITTSEVDISVLIHEKDADLVSETIHSQYGI